MKQSALILITVLMAGTALAQWPRPVQTQGTVTTNDPVVFSDATGKYIKSGSTSVVTITSFNTHTGKTGTAAHSLGSIATSNNTDYTLTPDFNTHTGKTGTAAHSLGSIATSNNTDYTLTPDFNTHTGKTGTAAHSLGSIATSNNTDYTLTPDFNTHTGKTTEAHGGITSTTDFNTHTGKTGTAAHSLGSIATSNNTDYTLTPDFNTHTGKTTEAHGGITSTTDFNTHTGKTGTAAHSLGSIATSNNTDYTLTPDFNTHTGKTTEAHGGITSTTDFNTHTGKTGTAAHSLGSIATSNNTDYTLTPDFNTHTGKTTEAHGGIATAAQGALADTALQNFAPFTVVTNMIVTTNIASVTTNLTVAGLTTYSEANGTDYSWYSGDSKYRYLTYYIEISGGNWVLAGSGLAETGPADSEPPIGEYTGNDTAATVTYTSIVTNYNNSTTYTYTVSASYPIEISGLTNIPASNLTNKNALGGCWGFTDPIPTNALHNFQRFNPPHEITISNIATIADGGTSVWDLIRWENYTNATRSYTTVITGILCTVDASNTASSVLVSNNQWVGLICTNVNASSNANPQVKW